MPEYITGGVGIFIIPSDILFRRQRSTTDVRRFRRHRHGRRHRFRRFRCCWCFLSSLGWWAINFISGLKLFSLRARFTLIWFWVISQKPETDDELNSPLCPTCRTCLDLHGWGWMLVEVRWLELASPRNIGYCNLDLASSFSRTNNYEAVAQLVESLLFTLEVCTVRITSKTQLNFLPTQIVI